MFKGHDIGRRSLIDISMSNSRHVKITLVIIFMSGARKRCKVQYTVCKQIQIMIKINNAVQIICNVNWNRVKVQFIVTNMDDVIRPSYLDKRAAENEMQDYFSKLSELRTWIL